MASERKIPVDFGSRMRLARDRLNVSRKALSRLMNSDGASETTIKNYESKRSSPGSLIAVPFIARLAEVTGVPVAYFWGDDSAWPGVADGPAPISDPIMDRLGQIETTQQEILRRLKELGRQQGMLTELERDRLSEIEAVLNRLGRDVGRGQPRQRSGQSSPPAASELAP